MKRLLYAAALVAVMGLIGCGSKVDDKETSTVNNTVTQKKSLIYQELIHTQLKKSRVY